MEVSSRSGGHTLSYNNRDGGPGGRDAGGWPVTTDIKSSRWGDVQRLAPEVLASSMMDVRG